MGIGLETPTIERHNQRPDAGHGRPYAMKEIRDQHKQHQCQQGKGQRNVGPAPSGPEHLSDADHDERLSGQAYGKCKLVGEIPAGSGAIENGCARAHQCADKEGGEGGFHDKGEACPDKSQQEQRADPPRDAQHGADIPGRHAAGRDRGFAGNQAGLFKPCPQRRGVGARHERASFTTCLRYQPPAPESPMTTKPINNRAPASPDFMRCTPSHVVTTTISESTPPAST
jgi:hypothetical protein